MKKYLIIVAILGVILILNNKESELIIPKEAFV